MKVPRLDLRRVSFAVNSKRILKSVSWIVAPEEHWAILGPNGAGKTTLLKIVCGYLWPNAGGEVYRNGHADLDLGDLRRSIGWVTSTLVDEVPKRETVLDTVISGKYAQVGLWRFSWEPPTASDAQRALRYLRDMGCENLAQRHFGTLSQGEQQKILICRAQMTEPYLTILDEPCAGMDPGAREVFLSSLLSIGRRRKPSELYLRDPPRGGDSAYLHEDPYTQGWQGHEEREYARRAFRPKHQRALWHLRASREETWPLLAHTRVIPSCLHSHSFRVPTSVGGASARLPATREPEIGLARVPG